MDSGATHHIASDAQSLEIVHDYQGTEEITMGNGNTIPISHTGNANISASNHHFKLLNTLCSPLIKTNLISVSQFCRDNYSFIEFFPFHYLVKDLSTGAPLVRGQNKDGLYEWPPVCTHRSPQCNVAVPIHLWHRRLGHPNRRVLNTILNNFSLPVLDSKASSTCNSCYSNKMHRLTFSKNSLQSNKPLQILFSDLWGPSPVLSIDRKRYYVLFVDQFSKYMWLFTLKSKNETVEVFQNLHPLLERRFNTKIQSFYTDGGGEFQSLQSYLKTHGIEHLVSSPYTPQRVALVERRHRHVIETARTLLHQASLPSYFWSFACQQAVYLINRLTTPNLQNKSPFEIIFQTMPKYDSIKVFGCLCYPWLKPYAKNKLEPRLTPCVYLGFSNKHYCHQWFDPFPKYIYHMTSYFWKISFHLKIFFPI